MFLGKEVHLFCSKDLSRILGFKNRYMSYTCTDDVADDVQQYQVSHFIKGSLIPVIKSVLPYLKNVALDGVLGLVDELKSGKSFKEATSDQLKRSSETVLNDMAKRIKKPQQAGSGVRKRRQKGRGIRRKTPVRKTSKRRRATPGLFR